jgi:hypothetical protein
VKNLIYLLFLFSTTNTIAQFKNNIWLSGQEGINPPPWGGNKIVFEGNSRTISSDPRSTNFSSCFAGICDDEDNWFLYSNGEVVCNNNNDTIINGGGLSPYGTGFNSGSGRLIPGQAVFLPFINKIYLFHQNESQSSTGLPTINPYSPNLFYSIIDPLANNGQGAIVSKNNTIEIDTLEIGNLTSVRHANGRDWWIIIKRFYYNKFYALLVTPDSVFAPIEYNLSVPFTALGGQACISPNGMYYAGFSNGDHQLRIYDVDRCSGKLENYRQKFITNRTAGSTSFSPNSRFLYISSIDSLWQFDMLAQDVLASQTFISSYDGYLDSTFTNLKQTTFWYHWLAPDGKIYLAAGTQSRKLHVINNPDLLGTACNFQQHSISIPSVSLSTVPTSVNYFLKQESGSPCDTLGVGLNQLQISNNKLQIFPNPSNGKFSLEYSPQVKSGMLYVYDMAGKEVYREYVSPYTSFKNLDLSAKLNNGMYALSLVFGQERETKTIVIEKSN